MGRKRIIYGKCPACKEVLRTDRTWAYIPEGDDAAEKLRIMLNEHLYHNPSCVLSIASYKTQKINVDNE